MGQQREAVEFGDFLRRAIQSAGFASPTHYARTVNLDPSVVLRWLSGSQRPTIRSLERVAPILGRSTSELVRAAYPDKFDENDHPVGPQLHDLGHVVGRLLATDSPLPNEERKELTRVIEAVLKPYQQNASSLARLRRRGRADRGGARHHNGQRHDDEKSEAEPA